MDYIYGVLLRNRLFLAGFLAQAHHPQTCCTCMPDEMEGDHVHVWKGTAGGNCTQWIEVYVSLGAHDNPSEKCVPLCCRLPLPGLINILLVGVSNQSFRL